MNLAEIRVAAKAAFEAGNYAEVERLSAQGSALKSMALLEEPPEEQPKAQPVEVKAGAPTRAEVQRLDLTGGQSAVQPSVEDFAIKSWFTKKFGELPQAVEQMARELYRDVRDGADYASLSWAKGMDFRRFLKTGQYDPQLERLLVLAPSQILEAAYHGVSVREMKTTMIEGQDSLGGYLVPEDVRMDLIARLPGLTVVRSRAKIDQTSRDRVTYPKLTGGSGIYPGNVRVTWVDESPLGTEAATNETWGQLAIPVETVMASATLSKNLLEDSAFDLVGRLSEDVSIAYALDEDNQFLTGAGTNKPAGILTNNTTGGPSDSSTTTVVSGVAAGIAADTLLQVPFSLDAQYRQSPGIAWAMAKATLLTIRQLKDGEGRYLWDNNQLLMQDFMQGRLVGYPIAESEQLPPIAANNYPIIFGDFKGYQIVDRIGMSMLRYDDSSTAKTNSVVYVARRRLGGQVREGYRFIAYECHT